MAEPLIHSHSTDVLPEDHPLANENVTCSQCGELVHFRDNECMQTWIEMREENLCTECFGKRDMTVLGFCHAAKYQPTDPTLPKIIAALGWQGGTVEQVVAEVARLRADDEKKRQALMQFLGADDPVKILLSIKAAADALVFKSRDDLPEAWRNRLDS